MAFSTQRITSNGTLVLLDISIEYFDRSEIAVLFNGVVNAYPWAWVGSTESKISFSPAVPNTVEVMLVRTTDLSQVRHMFTRGAQFTTESIDEDLLQILHIAQEAKENATIQEVFHNLNMHGYRISNIGDGINAQDSPSMAQMVVHDAQIVVYRDQAAASAAAAAASAASINPAQFPISATPNTIPMSNPTGNGWLYKTVTQLKGLLGLGTAAYTDSTTYQAYDADIPTVAASQVEMEAGTETALRSMSPLRVKQAVVALAPSIGVGQTWQDLTASRALSTTYTNSTGRPIQIAIGYTGAISTPTLIISGLSIFCNTLPNAGYSGQINIIVPNGSTYRLNPGGGESIVKWLELR